MVGSPCGVSALRASPRPCVIIVRNELFLAASRYFSTTTTMRQVVLAMAHNSEVLRRRERAALPDTPTRIRNRRRYNVRCRNLPPCRPYSTTSVVPCLSTSVRVTLLYERGGFAKWDNVLNMLARRRGIQMSARVSSAHYRSSERALSSVYAGYSQIQFGSNDSKRASHPWAAISGVRGRNPLARERSPASFGGYCRPCIAQSCDICACPSSFFCLRTR